MNETSACGWSILINLESATRLVSFFAEYYLPRGRLFSEFSDLFSFMECKIQMIIEFVFGGIFKERK